MTETKVTAEQKRNFLLKVLKANFEKQSGELLFENIDWTTMEGLDAKAEEVLKKYFVAYDTINDYYKPKIKEEWAMKDYEAEEEEED